MGKIKDLTGQTFGELTPIQIDKERSKEMGRTYWLCQCSCGNITSKRADYLTGATPKNKSCGCISYVGRRTKKENLVGQKFNRLTVLEEDLEKEKQVQRTCYKCQCDCGNIVSVRADYLKRGAVKSCGCYVKDAARIHGALAANVMTENLLGQKFGKLTVIKKDEEKSGKGRGAFWIAECECGSIKSYSARNLKRNQSCGCAISRGEDLIATILRELGYNFVSQYKFNDLYGNINHLRFDFAILQEDNSIMCLIEYQGKQHYEPVEHFGGESGLLLRKEYDKKKKEYCRINHIPLIEIPYFDFNKINKEYILKLISSWHELDDDSEYYED